MKTFWISRNENGPWQEFIGFKNDCFTSFVERESLTVNDTFYAFWENETCVRKIQISLDPDGEWNTSQASVYLPNAEHSEFLRCICREEAQSSASSWGHYAGKVPEQAAALEGVLDGVSSICGCCDAEFTITKSGICIFDGRFLSRKEFLKEMSSSVSARVYLQCKKLLGGDGQ